MSDDGVHPERSLYLRTGRDWTFVTLHPASGAAATAVIMCPPFGWEEVSSYRIRRAWARSLAQAGHSVLRVSLPSTGDSGGRVHDPDRLAAWTESIGQSAAWLREEAGAVRVAAIGLQLGGLLACRAAAAGAPIDDLVLWSVGSRGRTLVRQLRAFSRMETEQFFAGLPSPPPPPDGELEAAGFTLSAETLAALEPVDLAEMELPEAHERRALLLDRDGLAADERLAARLSELGVAVTRRPGDGYARMTSHPQDAALPAATMAAVAEWIAAGPAPSRAGAGAAPAPPPAAGQLNGPADEGWTETPVRIEHAGVGLPGILTQPRSPDASGLCAVLLNAGAVRRIGPSRLWVQTARRWAARGVATLRLDVEGIGDADGPEAGYQEDIDFSREEQVAQVAAALDFLRDGGIGERFLLAGLCSGAYWAFLLALDDDRVCAAGMINCRVLAWQEDLAASRYVRTLVTHRPSLAHIRTILTPAIVMAVVRWVLRAPARGLRRVAGRRGGAGDEVDDRLTRLLATGKRVMVLFTEREPLRDELEGSGWLARLEAAPAVTIERVAVIDHTLRPGWAQDQLEAALDRALDRELQVAAARDAISSSSGPA
jgi:dienelactone hydrolase